MAIFPRAQLATFTDPAGSTHKFHSVVTAADQHVDNVTGSGDTNVQLINGLPIFDASGIASIDNSGFGLSQNCQLTLGTLDVKPYDWTIGKRWALDDTTGSGDSVKHWCDGWPIVYGSIRAWVTPSGPLYQTQSMTFSAVFDVFGTVAGTAVVRKLPVTANIRKGGAIPVSIQWQATGTVTHGSPIIPFMDTDTTIHPYTGTLDVSLSSGEDINTDAVLYHYTVRATAQVGGPIVLACNFKFGILEATA